jgi:hypothetical protein
MTRSHACSVLPLSMRPLKPGHDAWILGNEPFVGIDFQGGAVYGKAKP